MTRLDIALFNYEDGGLQTARRLADPTAQARTHDSLANASIMLGRFDDAHTHLSHALDLHYLWERRNDPKRALDHARQAHDLYQAAGHHAGQAQALNNVGWYHAQLGDHQQALIACQQALALLQKLDNRVGQANTWDSLGYAHHHLSNHTEAITCYQHALMLFWDLGDRYNEADVLTHLGNTHDAAGNPTAARDAWQQALTILTDLDHPDAASVRAKLQGLRTA